MWVASGSDDSTIILWDTKGNIVGQWINHSLTHILVPLAFSPDSRYLVSGGEGRLLDLSRLEDAAMTPLELAAHAETIAWSPDGSIIAAISSNGAVGLWDARTFRQRHLLVEEQAMDPAQCLSFSPDGRWVVVGFLPCNYSIYDAQAGRLHQHIQGEADWSMSIREATFDPRSMRLVHTSGHDGIEIWDVETSSRLSLLRCGAPVRCLSFSPDGRLLLATSAHGTASVRDVSDAHTVREVCRLKAYVSKACFSPCGKYIASPSGGQTVRLWKTSDGSLVATFAEHDDEVVRLAFSADGKILVSGGLNGTVVIRRMDNVVSL